MRCLAADNTTMVNTLRCEPADRSKYVEIEGIVAAVIVFGKDSACIGDFC